MKEGFSYNIGYVIGNLITKVVIGFAKLIFAGTVTASSYCKQLPAVYGVMFVFAILSYAVSGTYYVVLIFTMITAIVAGLWVREKERPLKQRRKYFNTVFEEINLKSNDDSLPEYLYEENISNYALLIVFQTLIPLTLWKSKKELIEMYFNAKILDLKIIEIFKSL